MDHDARVQLVRRYWAQAWSLGRLEVLDEIYAPSYRENDEELTPAQFGEHLLRWRGKFADFHAEVVGVWSTPTAVISRVVYTGTHTGEFAALPATGRDFRTSRLDVFEFDQRGLVVQHWHETDHLDLFEQLGAQVAPPVPDPGHALR